MFDDQPAQSSGAVPSNLPVGEPVDMFSGVDAPAAPGAMNAAQPDANVVPPPPTALTMGALKPVSPAPPMAPSMQAPQSSAPKMMTPPVDDMRMASGAPSTYPTKGPVLSRILIMIVLIVILAGVFGGGGWFVYTKFIKSSGAAVAPKSVTPPAVPPTVPTPSPVTVPTPAASGTTASSSGSESTDSKLLFGEPVDSDGDGLTDDREKQLGTDPNNWDTDHDGLSDYDEVTIWKTDPKNPDTDGDGYQDGAEVKNGYNPAGPGKIFEPPTPVK